MQEEKENRVLPLIGDKAPAFTAQTTEGTVNFPEDYKGKWVILFSHPADFTPVCTSEIMTFGHMTEEFRKYNTELLGVSVDSVSSHLAWIKTMEDQVDFNGIKGVNIDFPIIADIKMDVSKKYGMIQPASSDTKAVRAVFYIDPKGIVRALLYYPLSNGRNFQEILRLLVAMQTTDAFSVSTPADWEVGDKVLLSAPVTTEDMAKRKKESAKKKEEWFFCMRDLSANEIAKKLEKKKKKST